MSKILQKMFKNLICVLIVAITIISIFSFTVSANDEISVMLDGVVLDFDVNPQIINGRTMVPMRKIFESLGANVEWDGNTKTITATRYDTTIVMQIDNNNISVNGNALTLDVPPQLVSERTLVPVRAVAESFDINVIWDDDIRTVLLSTYIPFDNPKQTFDYLCDWLLENGEVYAEYVYIGWIVDDGVEVEIKCFPDALDGQSNISFSLSTFKNDRTLTTISLWPTYDGTNVYASYISGSDTCKIKGDLNMAMHTNNYPLKFKECEPGEFESDWLFAEETRKRINYLLDECAVLLAFNNTKVTLNTLGFKKY